MTNSETPAETLARSAFGFALLALIPAIITWIAILFAPASPDATFRQFQTIIIVGFGVLALLTLLATGYTLRAPQAKLQPLATSISVILGRKWLALLLVIILIEANLLAFLGLTNIAPNITNPAKFLLLCWSLIVIGVIALIHRQTLAQLFTQTSGLWQAIGMSISLIVVIVALVVVNNALLNTSGVNDALRGGLDYRNLIFYDDGAPTPDANEFWQEQAQTRVRWSPYTYWVVDEFQGEFINIGAGGLRETPTYGAADDAKRVYVFGGSTVWGEGARDAYTIPGHLARLLADEGDALHVVNYGQTGYVSTQDLIWFQLQLAAGDVPDVAIFYQGFNDTLAAWSQDITGVSLQENMRLTDSEVGRMLRQGRPVLRLPEFSLTGYDFSNAAVTASSPEAIAERWFSNVMQIQALADAYGVRVLFVWQPAIIYKDMLSSTEQAIYERWDNERPGLFALYGEVDVVVRNRVSADNILIISELFADNDETIFHDLVHITEIGNAIVAEAILPKLNEFVRE